MRLIVTRPDADAAALAAKLAALGHEPIRAPLLELKFHPIPPAAFAGAQALIVTSRNALRALDACGLPPEALAVTLFAVGPATAEAGRASGFASVVEGPGTAEGLARLMIETVRPENGALLHVAGKHVAADMSATLNAKGFDFRSQLAYEMVEVGRLPQAMREAIAGRSAEGIIVMSPRTAEIYVRLVGEAGLIEDARAMRHYCMSDAVAAKLGGFDAATIAVAARPTEDDLLALIKSASGPRRL